MWTVVYIARSRSAAEKFRRALEQEGLMVTLKPLGSGDKKGSFQILVPESEIDEAQEIMTSIFARQ